MVEVMLRGAMARRGVGGPPKGLELLLLLPCLELPCLEAVGCRWWWPGCEGKALRRPRREDARVEEGVFRAVPCTRRFQSSG